MDLRFMGGEALVSVLPGEEFVVRSDDGWSLRSGAVRFADGSEHEAVLMFCDKDQGEHWQTAVWVGGDLVFQEDADFLERLGRTEEQVFPYRYRYAGQMDDDVNMGDDGWSG